MRARVQRCLRAVPAPGGAGGAIPLGFYLDENILTSEQETNSSVTQE